MLSKVHADAPCFHGRVNVSSEVCSVISLFVQGLVQILETDYEHLPSVYGETDPLFRGYLFSVLDLLFSDVDADFVFPFRSLNEPIVP